MLKQKSKIVNNIRKYRNKLGISQDMFSKRTNPAFYTSSKIKDGSTPDPRIETVEKIARELNVIVTIY